MMTPQEVASHAFSKATLGGYNLAQVDEFLDWLAAHGYKKAVSTAAALDRTRST